MQLLSGRKKNLPAASGVNVVAREDLRPDALMAVILVIGVIGLLLDTLIRLIEGEIVCR